MPLVVLLTRVLLLLTVVFLPAQVGTLKMQPVLPMSVPLVLLLLVLKVMLLTRVLLPQLVVFLPVLLLLRPKKL